MAIFAGVTASLVDWVNAGVLVVQPVLAAVLDHVEDPPSDPGPEVGEDPVRDTRCDVVSKVVAVEPHKALCVWPAAC